MPGYEFITSNVFVPKIYKLFKDYNIILAIEFFCQVNNQKMIDELINQMPSGKIFIFTVQHGSSFRVPTEKYHVDYYERFSGIRFDLFKVLIK